MGDLIHRPLDMNHKDFMLMQKTRWPHFTRVVIGLHKREHRQEKEIEWWCNENLKGRWFHSEAHEVYYFEDENSGLHFKLMWFEVLKNKEIQNV